MSKQHIVDSCFHLVVYDKDGISETDSLAHIFFSPISHHQSLKGFCSIKFLNCWHGKPVIFRYNRLWLLCRFSPSLFRPLGLPRSPSCAPCRVWKPSRSQLYRAAECAGSPPAWHHTTWGHTIRRRKPARPNSRGTSTCVTATSKSRRHTARSPHPHERINSQTAKLHAFKYMCKSTWTKRKKKVLYLAVIAHCLSADNWLFCVTDSTN